MKQEDDFEANLAGDEGQSEESKSSWFKRIKKGILTSTAEKKETPEGLWTKCPICNYICTVTELREHLFVCPKCDHHHRIGSPEYFEILFNDNRFEVMFENIRSKDFLHFTHLNPTEKVGGNLGENGHYGFNKDCCGRNFSASCGGWLYGF